MARRRGLRIVRGDFFAETDGQAAHAFLLPVLFEFRKISFVSPGCLERGCGFVADELRSGVMMALPLMLQLIGLTYSVRIDPYILKNAGTSCC